LGSVLKQLILTADDFGRSPEINAAIEHCHRNGFLTQASLMVNEPAVEDAVEIARRNPGLSVGLHLTLCDGRASGISALTDAGGRFPASPARAGVRYFFAHSLTALIQREIEAQCARFLELGFPASYWDGHAHLHLHPTILGLTLPIAKERGFRATRLVREPGPPTLLPAIFRALSRAAIPRLSAHRIAFTDHLFGLRSTGAMRTHTIAQILQNLPDGISELYFHPGAEPEDPDFPMLRALLAHRQITLVTSCRFDSIASGPGNQKPR
jgi:hopanoid biosynthesis associated protein HpnK